MADKKIIAVTGATGLQGGGLVRAILADKSGGFAARAITRDPTSDKAKALAALGAEVVKADVGDLDSLTRAFTGAHGAYCVTFFWHHMSAEREMEQAKTEATAAKKAKVQHTIRSTLEDTRRFIPLNDDRMPTLMGSYKVPHFDAKGASDRFFAEAGIPVTNLITSFYWDNFIYFGMGPKKGADGALHFALPMGDKKLGGIAAEDIGKCAYGIFSRGREYFGKTVGIVGALLTGAEMAASFSKALGQKVQYDAIPPATYRKLGFPGAEDIGNMFQYYADFEKEFAAMRSVAESRALDPELLTFDQWLAKNKDRIPLA